MKKIILIVLSIFILLSIYFRESLDIAMLKQHITDAGWLAPVLFMAIYILFTVLMLPGSILTIMGGVLFGYWGILINLSSAVIGASIAFSISKYISADWVRKNIIHDDSSRTKQRLKSLLQAVDQNGWQVVALLRLIPLVPFNILNYILGLTTVSLSVYIMTSAIFMLPGAIVYTYLGILGDIALQGDTASLIRGIVLAASLFIGLFLLIKIVKNVKKQDIEKLHLDV